VGQIRLNKIIADAGIASRRAADQLILEGRVSVDGQVVLELGNKFDPEISDIKVDGESLNVNKSKTYLAFHKPAGVISTMSDPEGRSNLGDYFKDRKDRLYHVGRLDKDSEGLILLTNEFNKQLSDQLLQGVRLEDGLARAVKVVHARAVSKNHHWVEITIHEGRYHIIRRLIESLGLKVMRLIRLDFGPITLGEMKPGRHRVLNSQEMTNLFTALQLKQ
jgi:23S rRNA pseudouridine2605 synthase